MIFRFSGLSREEHSDLWKGGVRMNVLLILLIVGIIIFHLGISSLLDGIGDLFHRDKNNEN